MKPDEIEARRRLFLPPSAVKVVPLEGDAAAYVYTDSLGRPCAHLYFGRARKPAWRHYFRDERTREARIRGAFASAREHARVKAERAANRQAKGRGLEIGDILSAHWGYEQTNIDYFECTALIGSTMVELREIAAMVEETEWHQGKSVPVPGAYKGEPMRRKAVDGRVKVDDVRTASRDEPLAMIGDKPVYKASHWTAYH